MRSLSRVSTRKLILTAMICGLVILLAGGVKLLQVAKESEKVTILPLGSEATLGDMTVSVTAVEPLPDRTVVTVRMSGVDAADAREGWRMLSGGKVAVVTPGPWADTSVPACGRTTVAPTECSIVFPAATGTVTVAYLRAGTQSQWSKAG